MTPPSLSTPPRRHPRAAPGGSDPAPLLLLSAGEACRRCRRPWPWWRRRPAPKVLGLEVVAAITGRDWGASGRGLCTAAIAAAWSCGGDRRPRRGDGGCGSRSHRDQSSTHPKVREGGSEGRRRLSPLMGLARSGQRRGRMVRLPVKIAPASAMVDDGGVSDVVFLSKHRHCSLCHLTRNAPGETLDLGLLDRMMTALSGLFSLLGVSFWSSCWLGQAREVAC